jgi:hypothetical protein
VLVTDDHGINVHLVVETRVGGNRERVKITKAEVRVKDGVPEPRPKIMGAITIERDELARLMGVAMQEMGISVGESQAALAEPQKIKTDLYAKPKNMILGAGTAISAGHERLGPQLPENTEMVS